MRIDSIKGASVYETMAKESKQSKKPATTAANDNNHDRLELSDDGLKFKDASTAAAKIKSAVSEDADDEKIQALKATIANGTYRVSSTELANAIVSGSMNKRA